MASHHLEAWSPELIAALKNKRYWRTQLTKVKKLPLKLGIVTSIEKFREVNEKYKEAEREYKNISKDAKKIRYEFLKERAEYGAKLKNTQAEKEIKNIIEVER